MDVYRCGACGSKGEYTQEEINTAADAGCLCMINKRRRLIEEGLWELDQD